MVRSGDEVARIPAAASELQSGRTGQHGERLWRDGGLPGPVCAANLIESLEGVLTASQGFGQVHRGRPDSLHDRSSQRGHRDQPAGQQEQAVRGCGEAGRRPDHEAAEIRAGRPATGQRAKLERAVPSHTSFSRSPAWMPSWDWVMRLVVRAAENTTEELAGVFA